VGREPAARVDDAVARHARVVAVVQRQAGEPRGARVAGDHRHHPVRRDPTARDAAHDVVDPVVSLAVH